MTITGGYIMIDCGGLNLLGGATPQTVAGLYDRLKEALALSKPIIAFNMLYGAGHPLSPVHVMAQQEAADTIICTASILQVWVTDAAEENVHIESLIN